MHEVLPKLSEGDSEGDWQKEFADQVNTDAVLASAILAATSKMEPVEAEFGDFLEEDTPE